MPAPSPYRSRLFQSVHHHSVRTARRAQRAWREIKAIASLGAQAVTYSFQRLWQTVQASHLQMPAPPQQVRLSSASELGTYSTSNSDTNTSSRAVVRVLSLARSLPLLETPETSVPLQAPSLYSAPQFKRPDLRSEIQPVAQAIPVVSSSTSPVAPRVGIRAIASQLGDRHVVLVTRHNELLDCLTVEQQTTLLNRIDTELVLVSATPQSVQIVHQPHTWQESISRLALPAQRLRQLPAVTERLLQSPIEHWQRLSQSTSLQVASTHPFVEPLRELVTRIPSPKQAGQIASQLALPPARQLVNVTAQLVAQLPKPTLPAVLTRTELLPPFSSSAQAPVLPATAVAWKQHLQLQVQSLWLQTTRGDFPSLPLPPALPAKTEEILEALPFIRSAWATRLLKPFRHSTNHWPNLNALKSTEAPLLPPSPPQHLLTPATIGFLRPAARGYVVLSRSPHDKLARPLTLDRGAQANEFTAYAYPSLTGLDRIPSPVRAVTAARLQPNATQARSPKQRQKPSSLKKRSKQQQAAANTYIDVEATDLGYDTSVASRSVHWLDRGVYAIEESALKAWQWWCELVEPEGAPKPINTLGASQEGRELLVAGTRRSQDIVIASAELGVALFQELWPMMWHLLRVLSRRASQVTLRILEWMISVALPVASRLTMALLRSGANWAEKQAHSRK
ncbi:MAG: hypothetical protein AAGE92_09820 [Cyanobacteria bacterium P01_G01_bin.4]